ncbi:hypothetical protein L227DRAFT_65249 [Lentinus tigrinus ALCF2SS1-6]|uniref:Uncharacterized protein n=1 Tax=Lentinus tigrinus ALCF2SS1-6 TaxID=1328759 RepID=A0A5C2SDG0_9APHY|nr:hypothetical protein L227DRAFT_65249 [Lentinus tigrinus ALCF2SS1-6]
MPSGTVHVGSPVGAMASHLGDLGSQRRRNALQCGEQRFIGAAGMAPGISRVLLSVMYIWPGGLGRLMLFSSGYLWLYPKSQRTGMSRSACLHASRHQRGREGGDT